MLNVSAEEAPGSANTPTVPTGGGDVEKLKLKGVLNMEERLLMSATSKNPSKEDQSPAGNINPLLLASARVGSCEALNVLLEREDAKKPPMMLPTQELLQLLEGGSSDQGRAAARDVEEGGDLQPAASVAAGALLKGVTPDGDTVLHAVAGNCWDCQEFLEYAKIIYDRDRDLLFEKNHQGDTPLHCAARAGNSRMVFRLINRAACEGADTMLRFLRTENKRQETALHEAVRFEALLGGADLPREENYKDDADDALEEKNIVKLLMRADPELANYPADGISPLYLAILLEKSTIALTLYEMSAGNLSYAGPDGQNALHVAVLRDRDTEMVELLVHWNKSLTTQVDNDGSTPLHFASSVYFWTGSYIYLKLLRRRPWYIFVWCPCRYTRNLEKVLKANPAAMYQADKNGSFPIHVAASVGAIAIIEAFHDVYWDSIGLRDAKGRTFVHVAVEKEMVDLVSAVCRTPSMAWILNMQDNKGNTALHLAIQAHSFRMFCALFGNRKVNLNLTNNNGETAFDLSRSKLPRGMGYALNSEIKIWQALWSTGANSGAVRWDKSDEMYSRRVKSGDEERESEKLRDAAQSLIVAPVLIASVAFSATFALPGGYRADDHTNGGTPTLVGRYAFDAFIMATTLAFICSSAATVGFAFAAIPVINLSTRRVNANASLFLLWSSIASLSLAFALGVYMVLAPVARNTAVAVFVITPFILLSANMEATIKLVVLARPLCIRLGLFKGIVQLLRINMIIVVSTLWPFVVTLGWNALGRIHRQR